MVFGTIRENIRSFFQREPATTRPPPNAPRPVTHALPLPASEDLEQYVPRVPIVDKPLPASAAPTPHQGPLGITAAELRDVLQQARKPPTSQPDERHVPLEDLRKFEQAMVDIPFEHKTLPAVTESPSSRPDRATLEPLSDGFFASAGEHAAEHDRLLEALDGDVLHRLRSYHAALDNDRDALLHPRDVTALVSRRLHELQVLEHEWRLHTFERQELDRELVDLEGEIEDRSAALRTLVHNVRSISLFARECADDRAFVLSTGERLRSLGALVRALERMAPETFVRHVDPPTGRNHFADWIAYVFDEPALAAQVRAAGTIADLRAVLVER